MADQENQKDNSNDITAWMRFFNAKTKAEFEEAAKGNEYLEEAYKTLVEMSADEEKRAEYEARVRELQEQGVRIN